MKWFLITLAIGLVASDKLDRTYLPPPGANLAGGILGSHDAPLEPPHHTHSEPGPVVGGQGAQPNFGFNGEPVNFGDKIPKVPVTTTSYAFSQTTTYPPGEGFETTALPINPVTGLPIQLEQGLQNFPYGPSQGQQNIQNLPGYTQTQVPTFGTNIQPSFTTTQAPTYGANIQPGFGPQGPTSGPVNIGSPGYDQFANQPLNQYQGQNMITPGAPGAPGTPQIPGSVYPGQNQGQLQYPGGQSNTQRFPPTGAPNNQGLDQYPGQNVINPGSVVKIPGGNQGLVQYPGGQIITGQQGFEPTTGSPINLPPGGNPSGVNYDGSQRPTSQGTYTGQLINVPNLSGTQPTQTSYPNQEPVNIGRVPSQYATGNQNYGATVPTGSENVYQPGSTPSTVPSTYNNGVSSTTLGAPSYTSSYSSVQPVYRPERPQAAADRNAVILNYENVRTPNGYSYSFDTSNGIHADESGIVDNGTKAQGSYSYIGDDGKVYSVIYTADENGFQPRGDHLPTAPPIPEAIQRVIEQAAKDKAAGIVHDGSYDEAKYGDHNYRGTANHRRPQNQGTNKFHNDQFIGARDDIIKPIAGIKDEQFDEGMPKDKFKNNLPIKEDLNENLAGISPSNQRNGGNNVQDVSGENGRLPGDFHSPRGDFDGNRMPITEGKINQSNDYGAKKQEPAAHLPGSRGNSSHGASHGATDFVDNNLPGSKNRRPFERRPITGGVKDVTEKYPGSNVNVGTTETVRGGFYNGEGQDVNSGSPNVADESGENININYNSVSGAPKIENKIQTLRKRIKENQRPDSTGNRNTQNNNGRLQDKSFTQESTETPSFSDYFKKGITNQPATQQDGNGYHYQQPSAKFEQNKFPTRFSSQEAQKVQPDQRRNEYVDGTTRKPFMTKNIYHPNNTNNQPATNVNNQNSQSTPNRYNENESTTRRPYTTPFNTDTSYTDYDDGDYATDQNIGNNRIQSTRKPADNRVTSRPYQSIQTTPTSQNVPSGQRSRVDQKGTVAPSHRAENSGTDSSGYTYQPTTQMPSHNSRFGNTEIPRKMKPQERRPTNIVPGATTAVGRPVTTQSPSGIRQPDYKYQTTGPNFKYPSSNVGSGYPAIGTFPGTGSVPPGASTPLDYYTSTYGPTEDYFSTTTVPPTSRYSQGSGSQVPSGTPGSYQTPRDETFQTGYHYGPPKTGAINLDGPGFFTPTGPSGVFPTSPTGTYQTTYQPGTDGFPSTTFVPITPGSQNTFISSQPGTFAPDTLPTGSYPGNYQNGPFTPGYETTIDTSTPGGKPGFVYPGSPGAQDTTGYEYGPTLPTYSTTESTSTIGTTPGSFIPTGPNGPTQEYSTTYRPDFQPTRDTFVGGPVDGFGRPIVTDQGGSHPGFGHPTQGPTGPINHLGPNFDGTDQTTTYPGSYDHTRVIGEDFSGPKQPQRFDPQTGYHYK